ncbi:MAG: glycosyltransferase family 4 protein [Candidatus Lloydbacteria bacterium]|nr:glycosyltransferase family 4 protein [Candidatus Lloydbacteria bacterium]
MEKKKKRILIFSLMYEPFVGGAEVAVRNITDRLPDFLFDMVTLRLNRSLPRHEQVGNVRVHRIGFTGWGKRKESAKNTVVRFPLSLNKYLFPFLAVRYAKKLHRKNPYDAAWSIMANYAGFAAMFFKKKFPHVPFVLTLQEGDPIAHILRRVRFVRGWFQEIFDRADIIQGISTFLIEVFAKKTMKYRGPTEVIPNGVDVALFSQKVSQEERQRGRAALGFSRDDILLISTSRLVHKNAVDDVIRSLAFLPPQVKFLVVGAGPDEAFLRALAQIQHVSERIVFIKSVDSAEVPRYLSIADIFVRPSRSEGMGNSFIEAMAAGLPVIGTPVGGIIDFLKDGETGLFCEVDKPESVAAQVKRLMEDKALREKISANARAMVEEKYDWNIIAKQMKEKVFERMFTLL